MRVSLLYEIECPRPWTETSLYDGFWVALEQVKVAEAADFHTVWSVEHPFLDQFSVASGSLAHDDICDFLLRFGKEVIPCFA